MVNLGEVSVGRDNNFNLIRFVAATAVLVSHAWPLSSGEGAQQPLSALTGHTLGTFAVFLFFAMSGFFIASSYARSQSASLFLRARALRLFPCLIVSVILVALVMGPLATTLSPAAYLSHPDVLKFIFRNISLAWPQYTLPGVFEANPYPAVEGSIWTLFHEVLCYGLVLLAGVLGLMARRRAMTLALLAYGLLWVLPDLVDLSVHRRILQTRELSLPFVFGITFWIWRDRIVLSAWILAGLAGLAYMAAGSLAGFPVMMLALTYGVFWCGYLPGKTLRQFNRLGDYSYGIYIYAFPMQGLVVWLYGDMGPYTNIALALPPTLLCAVLSWHLVERPALAMARPRTRMEPALKRRA
jgi:peptidoglycan/LPS O-acetylase OafA/YrhL